MAATAFSLCDVEGQWAICIRVWQKGQICQAVSRSPGAKSPPQPGQETVPGVARGCRAFMEEPVALELSSLGVKRLMLKLTPCPVYRSLGYRILDHAARVSPDQSQP